MSKWYDFPIRKDYRLNVKISVSFEEKTQDVVKLLEYKQATIMETIKELDEIDKEWIDKYFIKVLKDVWGFEDWDITLLSLDSETFKSFTIQYLTTRFRWVINKDNLLNPKQAIEQRWWVPYSAILAIISEKLHIDPLAFQERYTFEQMTFMLEWIEYWANAKTEEWQKKNKEKYETDQNYDSMLLERLSKV